MFASTVAHAYVLNFCFVLFFVFSQEAAKCNARLHLMIMPTSDNCCMLISMDNMYCSCQTFQSWLAITRQRKVMDCMECTW